MTDQTAATRIITLKGQHALSGFRREKLSAAFAVAGISADAIVADFIHIAEVGESWSSENTGRLAQLYRALFLPAQSGHNNDLHSRRPNYPLPLNPPC